MNRPIRLQTFVWLALLVPFFGGKCGFVCAQPPLLVPESLQPWTDWVTWDDRQQNCPTLYSSAEEPICFWPSQLELSADEDAGTWRMGIDVFAESWVTLPGSAATWPHDVRSAKNHIVVVERDGHPATKLLAGKHELSGTFRWDAMPQRIMIPKTIGIVSLSVNGNDVAVPVWDADGAIWLKRTQTEATGKDLLDVQVNRLIEDGIPVWLRTEIEVTVSGKSREETLGYALPEAWQLATLESSIPVAVDDSGLVKAQVRAGKWKIILHAFRTTNPRQFQFPAQTQPMVRSELIGLKSDPGFRVSEIEGLAMIDVTQTTYPEAWRGVPVYQWDTNKPFELTEKMRGMGQQSPQGVKIQRRFWIDDSGGGMTYQDHLLGTMQQIWRLDVAKDHDLGAVRVDDKGQLITANPMTGTSGVEIRKRDLNMKAIGRVEHLGEINATGWETDVDALSVTITLPPGWRALAVFGPDSVSGDWLTAWSLLDLFLLLIFSLAVFRLYGVVAGLVALLAFGLAYHEPGSPRYTWLLLLMPLALLKVVGDGAAKRWISIWKNAAIVLLLICLIPFLVMQTQSVIYPQLETTGINYAARGVFVPPGSTSTRRSSRSFLLSASVSKLDSIQSVPADAGKASSGPADRYQNLRYDPKARIQTGPAQPEWDWSSVVCVWNGPVSTEQQIKPILISLSQHRLLTVVRLLLLMLLAAILFGARRFRWPFSRRKATAAVAALLLFTIGGTASAEMPGPAMLETLRQRLLEQSDAFPNAAEIESVELSVVGQTIEMKAGIHAAANVAVPMPGRFSAWSPLSVSIDGEAGATVCRRDDYLWVWVSEGVHEVTVKGLLPEQTNWEWTFLLKPRHVSIDADGWKVSGISRDGVPDPTVFFVKEQVESDDQAAYDRSDFHAIVAVERQLEIGLIWKLRTTVTRLSQGGKAISIDIPLLANESVLTSNRDVHDGAIAVRMGANQQQVSWDSELPVSASLALTAPQTDQWVERWRLVSSPIWNVKYAGLEPVFEPQNTDLIPVWHPWPGETVTIDFHKSVPIVGNTMTVHQVLHTTSVGNRQRTIDLELGLESSLAGDFAIAIDPKAEISILKIDGETIPVQRHGANLIVPAKSGEQKVLVQWRMNEKLGTTMQTAAVELPVEASNTTSEVSMPESRWILWAGGPLRGPAIRFWIILVASILIAMALGSLSLSPLRRYEWVLLVIGLTQVHLVAAMIVVAWLFLLAWRGQRPSETVGMIRFNLLQLSILFLTFVSLAILVVAVAEGLLGNPEMFIVGNGSWYNHLSWFEPRSGTMLPMPYVVSISVWFYRTLMLVWALWLASALLRWLAWGWTQFSSNGAWKWQQKLS